MTQAAPFSISRELNAPPAFVYGLQTDPMHLANWMSPEGFKTIHASMDLRIGGTYHYGIESPDGMQMWGRQVFREIVPNRKLVYIQSFSDKDGGIGVNPMSPNWPREMLATTTFEQAGEGRTLMTITWQPCNSDELGEQTFDQARPGMTQGFGGTFAKLEAYLASLRA